MRTNWLHSMGPVAAVLLAVLGLSRPGIAQDGRAQEVSYALLHPSELAQPGMRAQPMMEAVPLVRSSHTVTLPEAPENHRFWDRDNSVLFAASAAFSAADFVVTRDNLRAGGQELNPVTRLFTSSTPALAMNFVGETAGVVGISYFFHKTGHHKLERAVSMVNIGGSATAVAFGLAHR
jgi:hypothetical protein